MDRSEILAEHVVALSFNDIPADVVSAAKLAVLDTLGCMVAGADASGCYELRSLVSDWHGAEQRSVIGATRKTPSPNAAFVNATAARALDIDPFWQPGVNVSAASVTAGFAVAESLGRTSGSDLLTAIVGGEDLAARVIGAASEEDGMSGATEIGAAAVAAKLLGLDGHQITDAVLIAYGRAAGSAQPAGEASMATRLLQGFAARSGVEAALLARSGFSLRAPQDAWGYFAGISSNDGGVLDGLGVDFPASRRNLFRPFSTSSDGTPLPQAAAALLDPTAIRDKFAACMRAASSGISQTSIDTMATLVENLEDIDDVATVFREFTAVVHN